jgi:hypothetical protein
VSPKSEAIVWAVALGANTARRLSAEWGISVESATHRLFNARRSGYLRKHSKAKVGCIVHKAARSPIPRGSSYGATGCDTALNLPRIARSRHQ